MRRGFLASNRSEEHTSELQSPDHLVCRLLLEKKKTFEKHCLAEEKKNTYNPNVNPAMVTADGCTLHYSCEFIFFFFNDTATTEIYTLSLHDALPTWNATLLVHARRTGLLPEEHRPKLFSIKTPDRKSTRLNSSHQIISYAVFCLKKKIKFSYLHLSQKNKNTKSNQY